MYLHIGANYLIKTKYIVGIFDIENTSVSRFTRDMFAAEEKKGHVVAVTNELPRSYIIYREKNETKVYLTPFSVTTLRSGRRRNLSFNFVTRS